MQYVKIKRTAAVGSLVLLAINLSLTLYPYLEHRFQVTYFGVAVEYIVVPFLFVFIIFIIWCGAHIYIKKMEMYRTEFLAERILNPYGVYAIGPFEEMLYRTMTIPTLEASYVSMPDGKEKHEVKKKLDLAKKWVDLGYIPKEDFPKHLKKYYLTKKQNRL